MIYFSFYKSIPLAFVNKWYVIGCFISLQPKLTGLSFTDNPLKFIILIFDMLNSSGE